MPDLRQVRTRSIRQPDLVIAGGPDSLVVLNAYMTRTWPRPVIVHVEDGAVGAAFEAKQLGAVNVLLGELSRDDVVRKTLDALGFGEPLLRGTLAHAPLSPANALTAVEQKVICLIANGQTNFEAAQALGVSPRTVQVHRYRAINKLAVRQRAAEAETRSRPPGA